MISFRLGKGNDRTVLGQYERDERCLLVCLLKLSRILSAENIARTLSRLIIVI